MQLRSFRANSEESFLEFKFPTETLFRNLVNKASCIAREQVQCLCQISLKDVGNVSKATGGMFAACSVMLVNLILVAGYYYHK